MNEDDTPCTVGECEGTGDRPKKKTAKKAAAKKSTSPAAKSGTTGKGAPRATKSKKKAAKPTTKPKSGGSKPTKKPKKSGKGSGTSSPKAGSVDPSTLTAALNYGIARIDQPSKSNHGWYVRLGLEKDRIVKFFSDKKLGGKAKSKAAATAFRDETFKKLPDKLKRRGAKPFKRKAA